jgi:hypothetical protein
MPRLCKECKHEVSWAAQECPVCGIDNPTGMDREVLWMLGAAATLLPIGLYVFFKAVLATCFDTWSRLVPRRAWQMTKH